MAVVVHDDGAPLEHGAGLLARHSVPVAAVVRGLVDACARDEHVVAVARHGDVAALRPAALLPRHDLRDHPVRGVPDAVVLALARQHRELAGVSHRELAQLEGLKVVPVPGGAAVLARPDDAVAGEHRNAVAEPGHDGRSDAVADDIHSDLAPALSRVRGHPETDALRAARKHNVAFAVDGRGFPACRDVRRVRGLPGVAGVVGVVDAGVPLHGEHRAAVV
mmetsp:Transcript_22694/g.70268  ORF Transcript_22694/g.70268 Transcript_22694/m.70268 type:complete len:221 (+) Transcript_22694:1582-2244(+)